MIKSFLIAFFTILYTITYAQNVGINNDGLAPDVSAGLDVRFTDKGFLTPRMTTAQRLALNSPATGLLVYQSNTPSSATDGFYYNSGTPASPVWVLVNSSSSGWNLTGNAGTTAGTSFIGTTDAVDFVIKTGNTERARFFSGGSVGFGTSTAVPNAAFEVNSSSKGILIPQVALANGISDNTTIPGAFSNPSLLVYNTASAGAGGNAVSPGYYYVYNGAWTRLASGGTSPTSYWTFASPNLSNNNTGSVYVGTSTVPGSNAYKFFADAGTTTSYNLMGAKGSYNNYLQLNIQNTSTGNAASSDIVATANNGDETTNYVDLGINGQNNSQNYFGGANDAYLYNLGQDFLIGTGTAGKHLAFLTGGGSQSNNERMRIQGTGRVGIGTKSPDQLLEVNGNVSIGDSTETGKIQLSNLVGVANEASDIYVAEDKMLRLSNSGVGQTGASLQLKNSDEDYLFSFEGRGGFRYYSRTTLAEKFKLADEGDIYLTTDDENTAIDARGNINDFYQLNIMNENSGANASTDIVATANNGDDDDAYINMGINSLNYDGTFNGNTATILNGPNVTYLYGNGSDMLIGNAARQKPLIFFTNNSNQDGGTDGKGTERMRILATGEVTIGGLSTVTSGVKLEVSGNIKATNVTYPSDRRLKTNIEGLNYGLKDILSLKPVKYNWIDPKQPTQKQIGLIAQEARSVIPELVMGDETKENLSINYMELVPVLINAMKEQQKQIEDLKEQVQKLQK